MTDNTRKPVGDGEVVVRLTREEAKWAAARLEPHSHNEHERAASRKLRAALDQEAAMSDERPDKCPTCGSDDPGKPGNDPANRGWELKVGIVPGAGWKPCPDPFHDDARLREVERELQKCKRRRESWRALASKYKQRLDIAHTRCDAALSELARTRRHLTTLRDAVEEVLERWDDSEVSEAPEAIYRRLRTALVSPDEKEVE